MVILIDLLLAGLPLLYGLVTVNYVTYFRSRDEFAEKTCTPVLSIAVLLHFTFIILRALHFRRHPMGSLPEALTVIALSVAIVYLYVEQIQKSKSTGAFILPMVVMLQLAASALLPHNAPEAATSELLNNPLFGLHAAVAVLGYSAFALGAVYAVMFLLLYHSLKRKRFGMIFDRLPSLDVLRNMAFGATCLGWMFLSATIALGVMMSFDLFPQFYQDPKFITTLAVWFVYGLMIVAYFVLGWRGPRSVFLSLAGFIFAVLAMMGSAFLWSSFHKFLS